MANDPCPWHDGQRGLLLKPDNFPMGESRIDAIRIKECGDDALSARRSARRLFSTRRSKRSRQDYDILYW